MLRRRAAESRARLEPEDSEDTLSFALERPDEKAEREKDVMVL